MNTPTKATFESTARILRDAFPHPDRADETAEGRKLAIRQIAHAFADEYARSNQRFDRARFLEA